MTPREEALQALPLALTRAEFIEFYPNLGGEDWSLSIQCPYALTAGGMVFTDETAYGHQELLAQIFDGASLVDIESGPNVVDEDPVFVFDNGARLTIAAAPDWDWDPWVFRTPETTFLDEVPATYVPQDPTPTDDGPDLTDLGAVREVTHYPRGFALSGGNAWRLGVFCPWTLTTAAGDRFEATTPGFADALNSLIGHTPTTLDTADTELTVTFSNRAQVHAVSDAARTPWWFDFGNGRPSILGRRSTPPTQ